MQISSLIEALADGEFHSGSELGERLGVSRTAIWKALDRLTDFGLACESYRGKGYRLNRPLDLLSLSTIKSTSRAVAGGTASVATMLSCESTNQSVRVLDGVEAYQVLLSEQQTAGKGRRGKKWVSPFAQNLYMSICFDWYGGAAALQGLSIVAGVAVAEMLTANGVPNVGLKWPNDIWINGDKVAGILVELEGEATSKWKVTLGVGVNVMMTDVDGGGIDQVWTNAGGHLSVSRSGLAADLIDCLCGALDQFKAGGFSAFSKRYAQFDALKGESVKLLGPDVVGEVCGIDEQGGLLMKVDDVVSVYHAGELSVRVQ